MKTITRVAVIFLLYFVFSCCTIFAQSVGINTDGSEPDNRAILDVKSNNKGVLFPRMTDANRDSMYHNVPDGMLIYNISSNELQIYFNNSWHPLAMGTLIPAFCVDVPEHIFGSDTVNCNSSGNGYSIAEVNGATSYNWTVPIDATIISGQGTTSIIVTFGIYYGNVSVRAQNSCGNSEYKNLEITVNPIVIADADGNIYNTITIGNQVWLNENLKTTKYNDGSNIPLVSNNQYWEELYTPGFCWYNNDEVNKDTYGALYNWYTVNTGKICPLGWHVPSNDEWKTLEIFLGMSQIQADSVGWRGTDQGTQLKNNSGWYSGGNGTNTSGFTALPSGYRVYNGAFDCMGTHGFWWMTSDYNPVSSWARSIAYDSQKVRSLDVGIRYGQSVRCIKD